MQDFSSVKNDSSHQYHLRKAIMNHLHRRAKAFSLLQSWSVRFLRDSDVMGSAQSQPWGQVNLTSSTTCASISSP